MSTFTQEIYLFFTAIGNARKQYDTYGPEEERMQNAHSRQGHTHYNYTRGFEGKKVLRKKMCIFCTSLCVTI